MENIYQSENNRSVRCNGLTTKENRIRGHIIVACKIKLGVKTILDNRKGRIRGHNIFFKASMVK